MMSPRKTHKKPKHFSVSSFGGFILAINEDWYYVQDGQLALSTIQFRIKRGLTEEEDISMHHKTDELMRFCD